MVACKKPFGEDRGIFLQNVFHKDPFPIQLNISNNLKILIFSMLKKNAPN
jgi:hypothetical protein